jgi:acyl carrier protein
MATLAPWTSLLLGVISVSQSTTDNSVDLEVIKEIVANQIGVAVDVRSFEPDQDLYSAGLTSLATVGLMLALEERFEVDFPDSLLTRGTFRSIASIAEAVVKLAH